MNDFSRRYERAITAVIAEGAERGDFVLPGRAARAHQDGDRHGQLAPTLVSGPTARSPRGGDRRHLHEHLPLRGGTDVRRGRRDHDRTAATEAPTSTCSTRSSTSIRGTRTGGCATKRRCSGTRCRSSGSISRYDDVDRRSRRTARATRRSRGRGRRLDQREDRSMINMDDPDAPGSNASSWRAGSHPVRCAATRTTCARIVHRDPRRRRAARRVRSDRGDRVAPAGDHDRRPARLPARAVGAAARTGRSAR